MRVIWFPFVRKVFQQEIQYKEEKIKVLDEELFAWKVKYSQLQQEAYSFQLRSVDQLHAVEREKNDLQARSETASKELIKKEQEITDLKNKMQQMEKVNNQKDDLINAITKEEDAIKNRLEAASKKIVQNEQEMADLKTKLQQLDKVNSQKDDIINTIENEKDDIQKMFETARNNLIQNDQEITDFKNKIQQIEKVSGQKDDLINAIKKEKDDLKNRLESASEKIIQKEQEITDLNTKMQQMYKVNSKKDDITNTIKTEKDDIQIDWMKNLTKENIAITLPDRYRPTRLVEMYGELYDNEWKEAIKCTDGKRIFPELQKPETEEIIVRHLYKILTTCFEECLQLSKEQCMSIAQIIQDSYQGERHISSLPGCIEVAAVRRQNSEKFATYLLKHTNLHTKIMNSPWDYPKKNADLMKQLMETAFFEKCVHLCWLMVIQEPAMHLSENILPATVYDTNVYDEFTQSGDKVAYVVWPALFLRKNGPLLNKGVVQSFT